MSNAVEKKLESVSKKDIKGDQETKKNLSKENEENVTDVVPFLDEGAKIPKKVIKKNQILSVKSDSTNEELKNAEKKSTEQIKKKKSSVQRSTNNIPSENVPKKVAHRSKGSLYISKCTEKPDQDKNKTNQIKKGGLETKNLCSEENNLTATDFKSETSKPPRSRIGQKSKETKEDSKNNKKKPWVSVLQKTSNDNVENELSDAKETPQTDITTPQPPPLSSCSFLEKLQQGVKAYFLSRSSLNADLDKNKKRVTEGGIQTGAGVAKGVTEELKKRKTKVLSYVTRNGKKIKLRFSKRARPFSECPRLNFQSSDWGGHSSIFFDNNLKVKRKFRVKKCKKLYFPKKHYVKIEIPRKGYFCRWHVQNKDAGTPMHSLHRMESSRLPRIKAKIQISGLASTSFKVPSIFKKRLTKSRKLKWSSLRKKSGQDLSKEDGRSHEYSPRDPLRSKVRRGKYKIKSKRGKIAFRSCVRHKSTMSSFSEIADGFSDIPETSCEKNISSETIGKRENFDLNLQPDNNHDSVSVNLEASTETVFHSTKFPIDVEPFSGKTLQDPACSSPVLESFFPQDFQMEFPAFYENIIHNTVYGLTEKPISCCHLIQIETPPLPKIVSECYCRPTLTDSYFENKLTATIIGDIDLHIELENYFKAIYEPNAVTNSKVYWAKSLRGSCDDNYFKICDKFLSNKTSVGSSVSETDVDFGTPTRSLSLLEDKITSSDSKLSQTYDTSGIQEFPDGKQNVKVKSKEFLSQSSGPQILEKLAEVSFETQSKEAKEIKSEPASKNQELKSDSYIKRTCAKVSLMEDKELLSGDIPIQNECNSSASGGEKEGKFLSETYERVYPLRPVSLKKLMKKHNVLYENLVYCLSTESIRPASRKVLSETDISPKNEFFSSPKSKDAKSFQKNYLKKNMICANSVPNLILCENEPLSSAGKPEPEPEAEQSKEKWYASIQDLADIYNEVLKQSRKMPRSRTNLSKCVISDHLLANVKSIMREKIYKHSQINFLKNVNDDVKIKIPTFILPKTLQSHMRKDDLNKLQQCVNNFQEILTSPLSINEIVHLNDIISAFHEQFIKTKSTFKKKEIVKSKSSVEKLNVKEKKMKEVKILSQAEKINLVEIKPRSNWPSKARSWTNRAISKDKLKGSFKKSDFPEKTKKIESVPVSLLKPKSTVPKKAVEKNETKLSSLSKMSEGKTELSLSSPNELGSILKSYISKTDQRGKSVSDLQKSVHHRNKKLLMTVKYDGDKIMVSKISQFENEKVLPKASQKNKKETSQLIIEQIAKEQGTRKPFPSEKNQKGKSTSGPLNNAKNAKSGEFPIKRTAVSARKSDSRKSNRVVTAPSKIRGKVMEKKNTQPSFRKSVKKQEEKACTKESGNDQHHKKTRSSSKGDFPENPSLQLIDHVECIVKYVENMKKSKFPIEKKTNVKTMDSVKATERKSSRDVNLTKKSLSFGKKEEKCHVVKKNLNDPLKNQGRENGTQYEKLITPKTDKVIGQHLRKIKAKAKRGRQVLPFRPPSTFAKYPPFEINNCKSTKNKKKSTCNKVIPRKTASPQKEMASVKAPEVPVQFQESSGSGAESSEKQLNSAPSASISATKDNKKVSDALANATDQSILHPTMSSVFNDAARKTRHAEWKSVLFKVLTEGKLSMKCSKLDNSGSLSACSQIESQLSEICFYSRSRSDILSFSRSLSLSDTVLNNSSTFAIPKKSVFSDGHITSKWLRHMSFAEDLLKRKQGTVFVTQFGKAESGGSLSENSKTPESADFFQKKIDDSIPLKPIECFLKSWSKMRNAQNKKKVESQNSKTGDCVVNRNISNLYQSKSQMRHERCLQSNINKNINSQTKKPEKSSTFPSALTWADKTQNKKRNEKPMIRPENKNQARSVYNNNKCGQAQIEGGRSKNEVKIDKVRAHTQEQEDKKSEKSKTISEEVDGGKTRLLSASDIDRKTMELLPEFLKIIRESIIETQGFKNKTRVVDILDKYLNAISSETPEPRDVEEKLLKVTSLEKKEISSEEVKLNDKKMITFRLPKRGSSLALLKEIISNWKSLKLFKITIHSSSKSKKETKEQTQQQQQQHFGGLVTEKNKSECQKASLLMEAHQSKVSEIKILKPLETDSKVEGNENELRETPSTYFDAVNTQTESQKPHCENSSCAENDETVSSTVTKSKDTTEVCEKAMKSPVSLSCLDLFSLYDHQQKERFEETLFNEILDKLKSKNYYYSILLLEGWLKKVEKQNGAKNYARNFKLKKVMESLHETSKDLLASLEKKGWTKMLYLAEDICDQCEKLWNEGNETTQLAEINESAKFSRNILKLQNIECKITELLTYFKKYVNVTSVYKNKIENYSYEKMNKENQGSLFVKSISPCTNLRRALTNVETNTRFTPVKLPCVGEVLVKIGDSYNFVKHSLGRIWYQLSFFNENAANPVNPEAFRISGGQPSVQYYKCVLLALKRKIRKQRLDIQYTINTEPASLEIQSLKNSVTENMIIIEKYLSLLVK